MPLVVVVELRHSFMALNNGLVMVVLTIRLCVVITGKSAFFWGVESIRLSCRRGRCFAAGPVGGQGSAYLYFFLR